MLEYAKLILDKVSFSRVLVNKEYKKSLAWLAEHEAAELKNWVRAKGYIQNVNETKVV